MTRRPRRSVTAVVGVVVPSVDRSIPGPVGASALDSRARESPALVLGGRLGRGPRGHGLVDHHWPISLIRAGVTVDAVTSHTYACQFWEISLIFAGEMVREGVGTGEAAKY